MPVPLSRWLPGLLLTAALPAIAADAPEYGPELQGFEYPYTVKHFAFESQGKSLQMGYMDVAAHGKANGRSVVLMHGKNFCGATWETSIKALSDAGYRVIAPDQIGFCTSSKPDHYQYSFQQLAANTQQLLKALGIQKATLLGHSTGGMLATRYALQYPSKSSNWRWSTRLAWKTGKPSACPTAASINGTNANSRSPPKASALTNAIPITAAAGSLNSSAG